VTVTLYIAAPPLRPAGPEGADAPLLPEGEWRRLDPAHRPACYTDAAGETIYTLPVGTQALGVFKAIPSAPLKATALYFKKRSGVSRMKAEAATLTALAGDYREYIRVFHYEPDELERWWRETVLTAEGRRALLAFRREYDKRRLFG
jgi:hypothetical protein